MRQSQMSAWLPGSAAKWQLAFTQLLQADLYAQDTNSPRLQFAVEIEALVATGLTTNDMRWLTARSLIEHTVESSKPGTLHRRCFRSAHGRALGTRSCLLLTKAGVVFAWRVLRRSHRSKRPTNAKKGVPPSAGETPHWDIASRRLWLGTTLVKRLTVPAANQEIILAMFEERHWPSCIDDPLPPTDGIDLKRRLHDAINRLNRSHKARAIRFTGNGKGNGVCWTVVDERR